MNIFTLFPTAVGKFTLDREFTKQELKFVEEAERRPNMGNQTSVNNYVLKEKPLKKLGDFLLESANKYFAEVYKPKDNVKLYITQSWLNYTKEGQYHHTHEHPNSFASGVLYFDADFDTDKIFFHKKGYQQIKLPTEKFEWYNSDSWFFQVKTGDIIMFPSSLTHNVETKKGENRRVSLAFNTFPVGYLGEEESLTALHTSNPLRP